MMSAMTFHSRPASPKHWAALAVSTVVLLSSCSAEQSASPESTTPSTSDSATSIAPATTPRSDPTTTTSTSTSTTILEVQQSEPIAPPSDTHADEPVIELGSIEIPAIGVNMTLYEGIRLTTLAFGPGHWPGSAEPGQVGNVVVAGHRTSKHKVFRNLDDLVAGDKIIFHVGSAEFVYLVNRIEIVEPTDVWIINPTDTPTATLFACHPPGSTTQRIVVFADLAT